MQDSLVYNFVESDDFLSPDLRNIIDKLTKLRNLISENTTDDIGYSDYTEADVDWKLVNGWLNNTLTEEIYPSKQTLILANKLWKKYRGD